MPRLVHEDEEHESDSEAPAPDQRIATDGDEDAEKLQRAGDLEEHAAEEEQRRQDAAHPSAPRRRTVGLLLGELGASAIAGLRVAHEPCPIHSSPPT